MSQRTQERDAQTPTTSQTTTQTSEPEIREEPPRILRLRGAHAANRRGVQWAEDVVDNEGLGRKSSKVCCIYHRPKGVDESSDESSSDSSSSSGSDSEAEGRKKAGGDDKGERPGCEHGHDHRHGRRRHRSSRQKRLPSPNAYEKVPKPKSKQEEPTPNKSS